MPRPTPPAIPSGIRDNHHRGSVGAFLREHLQSGSQVSIVSAYFTIYAFAALQRELEQIGELRFLFGEPRFISTLDPERTDKKAFKIEDEGLTLTNRLQQKAAAHACAHWIQHKVQIRSIRQTNLLHGKMYHLAHHGSEAAILGSSNFTVRGLGLGTAGTNNIELNLEVDGTRDRRDVLAWFDELWHDERLVEDVRTEVLQYLEQLYDNHPPQFIYYKTLFHLFEQYLADQQRSGLLTEQHQLVDTHIWQSLFAFQRDGVKGAINKILTHNGCIIADSVGLGKTYEALAVIKYFELLNYRVLVLCPKKLRENWTVYQAQNNSALNPFMRDRFGYTVLSHTDLSRDGGRSGDVDLATLNWGNYDLVVIDESHNFRNNTRGRRDEEGQVIRKSRYERLMDDIIKGGIKTKVLLLSATPVNNDLQDLRNQLYFLTEGRDDAFKESLGVAHLTQTLVEAQRTFTEWAAQSGVRNTTTLLERLSAAFFTLLDELTIARSRKHILTYYADTIDQLGGFPERLKPLALFPDIDRAGRFMSYARLNAEISQYQLALFNPAKYVLPEYRARYETGNVRNFSQNVREHFLIGMMKVNFLKRLESSVASFAVTMDRTIAKIEDLEQRIATLTQASDAHVEIAVPELVEALDDEELQAALQIGQNLTYNLAHLDTATWLADLQRDKQQLELLHAAARQITVARDAKLHELKNLIAHKVQQPTITKQGTPNRKVLVFTAFADTAAYLYDALRAWAHGELGVHVALVTGTGANRTTLGASDYNTILTNFAPRAKQRARLPQLPQDHEIDLLIATDCISEGQNLQDCDYVVNYDIHWNPVRIIQRFGRVDRIGSQNQSVQLVNFWPTPDLNQYLNLKNRVEARMALVDVTATGQDNLLNTDVLEALATEELSYRDKQLLRLKDEVLDLEDLNESVALTEFTLDDFRIELATYIESNRQRLHDAPLGLYAIVPTDPQYPVIAPGVIFCLRQTGDTSSNEAVNPLQPYFLVYIRDDGDVRYSFAQPRQILDMYRVLCADKSSPMRALCELFDQETRDGAEMRTYTTLLERAVAAIAATFRRRAIRHLQSGRGGMLMDQAQQANTTTDFELITWLIIK